ncbi:hypothetical protein DFH07DRAFT_1067975 [Mycena maculata]|uniref:Uncharacterized protein n=1 Tax=Mycena maculata TaxID=230809 RepID=A0AAD7HEU9_9AGAR|nr:hypothetical protein DFH07DRAFT_1067975 [Mycena maculata]
MCSLRAAAGLVPTYHCRGLPARRDTSTSRAISLITTNSRISQSHRVLVVLPDWPFPRVPSLPELLARDHALGLLSSYPFLMDDVAGVEWNKPRRSSSISWPLLPDGRGQITCQRVCQRIPRLRGRLRHFGASIAGYGLHAAFPPESRRKHTLHYQLAISICLNHLETSRSRRRSSPSRASPGRPRFFLPAVAAYGALCTPARRSRVAHVHSHRVLAVLHGPALWIHDHQILAGGAARSGGCAYDPLGNVRYLLHHPAPRAR